MEGSGPSLVTGVGGGVSINVQVLETSPDGGGLSGALQTRTKQLLHPFPTKETPGRVDIPVLGS